MEISPFKKSFLEVYSLIYSRVFSSPPWHEQWTEEAAYARLEKIVQHKNFIGLTASIDSSPRGFILGHSLFPYQLKWFFVKELFIDPKAQRGGIGKKLIETLTDLLLKLKYRYVFLVTLRGSSAESFYKKMGFNVMFCGIGLNKYILMCYSLKSNN